jgi:integrase
LSNTCNQDEKPVPKPEVSLADILDRVSADETLPKRRRNDVASAIRTLSRVFGRPPAQIAASAPSLRARLKDTTAALAGLSDRRFKNVISLMRFALNHSGVADWPASHLRTLTAGWRRLLALTRDNQRRFWLSKFAGYCSANGYAPEQVSDTVVDQFYRDLECATLKRNPETVHRKVCQFWNECAVNIAEWPKIILTVPDRRKTYTLPWSAFPASFVEDLEAYLAYLAGNDVMEIRNFRPLRPSSIKTNRELIRQYASALVHCGHDPHEIKLLSDLLPIEIVKKGLRYYTSRANGSGNRQAHRYLVLLNTTAKRWAGIEPAHADQLKLLLTSVGKKIGGQKSGLTEKNKTRLAQFDSDNGEAIDALLNAPQRIMSKLPLNRPPTHDEALAAQTALAIEILVMIPLRVQNAVGLDLERQIIRGRDGSARIAIASEEVKNRFDIEAPLPKPTAELLDLYLMHFRPRLKNANTRWLFPGRGLLHPKSIQQLRKQFQDTFARDFGLKVNPHLFRHLAAMIFLRANPGQYGVVKLLLGHKSIETTMAFYCGFEASAAVRQYDQHVLGRRSGLLDAGATPG